MQVVLESPQEGRQYVFELNDRLIRDKELDGLTEIPVKPNTTIQQPEPDSDGLEELVPLVLPGQSLMIAIYISQFMATTNHSRFGWISLTYQRDILVSVSSIYRIVQLYVTSHMHNNVL